MRRLSLLLATVLAGLGVAACGSSSPGSGGTASPTVQALSYFPTSTPLVLTLTTNPKADSVKQAQALEHHNPSYAAAATAIFARLSQLGIDYNQDIRPLFGNPIAVGVISASGLTGSKVPPFLVTWVTKSASTLSKLIGKLHLTSAGTHDGAKLYTTSGAAAAVAGPTLIFARSTDVLNAALNRHAGNQGFDPASYAQATTGISSRGVIKIFGDLTQVLAAPSAAKARQVPWVAAIKRYGLSISAGPHGLSLQYHVDTTGRSLSVSQLPIASGASVPVTVGTLPIQAAVRDPAQVINFIEQTARVLSPAGYAKFLRQEAALKRRSGVDIGPLAQRLTGDLSVESDTHTTMARAQVSNPSRAVQALSRFARTSPVHASRSSGPTLAPLGGGMYSLTRSKSKLIVGVVGDELVFGRATAGQLRAYATAPPNAAAAGTGSVTFRIALTELLRKTLRHAPPAAAQQVFSLLGDITGSAEATTSGLSGTATLPIR
jgi:hypothetical protein